MKWYIYMKWSTILDTQANLPFYLRVTFKYLLLVLFSFYQHYNNMF